MVASSTIPIKVQACQTGITQSDMLFKTDGNYRVEFVNNDSRTVDSIRFVIHLGQQEIFILDFGHFAPGVPVNHRFPDRGGEIVLVGTPAISCEVRWVHFTDGSEWMPSHEAGGTNDPPPVR